MIGLGECYVLDYKENCVCVCRIVCSCNTTDCKVSHCNTANCVRNWKVGYCCTVNYLEGWPLLHSEVVGRLVNIP